MSGEQWSGGEERRADFTAGAAAAATIDRLARIETKLDEWKSNGTTLREQVEGKLEEHEARLDKLDRLVWLATGMGIAGFAPDLIGTLAAKVV